MIVYNYDIIVLLRTFFQACQILEKSDFSILASCSDQISKLFQAL